MDAANWYISTIAPDAPEMARKYGFGLEIAEFCTAYNMDEQYAQVAPQVRAAAEGIRRFTFHAPFNELFPCAIDPRARDLARDRYLQAVGLAEEYGAKKIIIHGGYQPQMYYPVWYVGQSPAFWRGFMELIPQDVTICLENVFEPEPEMLTGIVSAVNDPRLGICLDVGHINAYSKVPAQEWIRKCGAHVKHFHIHNNAGEYDSHSGIDDGALDIRALIRSAGECCPDATFALEVLEARPSVEALMQINKR